MRNTGTGATGNALIIDQRTTYSIEVCRSLARLGYAVDVFAETLSPVLRSRFCRRRLIAPSFHDATAIAHSMEAAVQQQRYDVIYLCSEEVLPHIAPLVSRSDRWKALPLSEPDDIQVIVSKHAVLERVSKAGVPIPRTVIPASVEDVIPAGSGIGFPLLIKGDQGEGSQQVRMVDGPDSLQTEYAKVSAMGRGAKHRPALQEYITGPKYTVGGLCVRGKLLRVIAYLSELTFPPRIGGTIRSVTARPPGLIETAAEAFDALRYTGLGNLEFIHDPRDQKYKLLEINPRVWGCIGFAQHAGVDLYTPYHAVAQGRIPAPDLGYKTGLRYRRWLQDLRLVAKRPRRLFGFVADCLHPNLHSDFDWGDLLPTFSFDYYLKRLP